MREKPTARRRRKQAERPAAGSPAVRLHFYAEPGLDLEFLVPGEVSTFTKMFQRTILTCARNSWNALGAAQRTGLLSIEATSGYARANIPEDVEDGIERELGRHIAGMIGGESWAGESFTCGECSFRVSFRGLPGPQTAAGDRVKGEDLVAEPPEKDYNSISIVDKPSSHGGLLSSPADEETAARQEFDRLVEEVATERERQVTRIQPVLSAYLQHWDEEQHRLTRERPDRPAEEIAQAKKELVERVNRALERLDISLNHRGQPCDLRVVVSNSRRRGGFLLTAKGSGDHLDQKANVADLFNFVDGEPHLRRDSQRREALSEWRDQERARQAKPESPPMR